MHCCYIVADMSRVQNVLGKCLDRHENFLCTYFFLNLWTVDAQLLKIDPRAYTHGTICDAQTAIIFNTVSCELLVITTITNK